MENHKITTLPNGIRIISETLPYVKSFSLGFWFNTGSRDESESLNGVCHFIEHMLFKGTKKRSARKIADDIESLGGYLNAFTSKEHTCFYGRGLAKHIEKTFEVLADMVQNPSFKETEMKKEAGVVIDEMDDIEDSPEELIFDKFESVIFKSNQLGLPIIGTAENLIKFTQKDLFDFIERNYAFGNFYIAASGAVDHDKLVEFTKKYITRDYAKKPVKRKAIKLKKAADLYVNKEIQQAHYLIGKTACGYLDRNKRTKVSLLSHILGEGSSSRLFQSVRERNGIAYQVNSFLNSFLDISTFGVYLATNEKMVIKAVDLVSKEFKKLKEKKVSEKELSKVKEYFKGSIHMGLEGTTNRMIRSAQSMIYYNRIKPISESIEDVDSITRDDIFEIANEMLNEEEMIRVMISPKDLLA